MERICVYAGSNPGTNPAYAATAAELARVAVERGLGVVYGGGKVGLMGVLADAALEAGGEVIGVLPEGIFRREIPHGGLTELHTVGSMHERKALMGELSDGFIALPGGPGTLEELFEVYTWTQLGIHRKGSVLLNIEGYWDGLVEFLDHSVAERFLKPEHRAMLMVATAPAGAIDALASFQPPDTGKWLDMPPRP
jgi:uncharacterized protein (TIGR00730 family)